VPLARAAGLTCALRGGAWRRPYDGFGPGRELAYSGSVGSLDGASGHPSDRKKSAIRSTSAHASVMKFNYPRTAFKRR
jgi:hypothetical protein